MEYSIIQWNLRGFQANFEELALLSRRYKPAAFGLQETFLTSSKTPSFSGFSILTKNSPNDRATGGVALLINKSYLFSEVHLNTPLQAVAARVTLNKVVTFCSIYLPPSDHVAKTDLINLTEQLPSPFVLLGDFNGHSPVWGNESYNSRGQMLEDLFSEMDLCILNDGSSTYIVRRLYQLNELINLFTCLLPDDSSIYTAELKAILLALKHVYYSKGKSFLILSDSLSSLQSIFNLKYDHPALVQILDLYTEMTRDGREIVFIWVPGQVGIRGNSAAGSIVPREIASEISGVLA